MNKSGYTQGQSPLMPRKGHQLQGLRPMSVRTQQVPTNHEQMYKVHPQIDAKSMPNPC